MPTRSTAGRGTLNPVIAGSTPRSATNHVPFGYWLGRHPLKVEKAGSKPPGDANTRAWRNGRRTCLRSRRRRAWRFKSSRAHQHGRGGRARLIAPVPKTGTPQGDVSSNLTPSANCVPGSIGATHGAMCRYPAGRVRAERPHPSRKFRRCSTGAVHLLGKEKVLGSNPSGGTSHGSGKLGDPAGRL